MKPQALPICISVIFLLVGCSVVGHSVVGHSGSKNEVNSSYLPDGIITLVRQMPTAVSVPPAAAHALIPGTLPAVSGAWLKLDREAEALVLMNGDKQVLSAQAEGINRLSALNGKIVHKQKSPLWYAPDSYFVQRKETVPAQGDKARFRRGALGEFAIFLDKDTPIHCGPFWSEEIGGIRVSENDLARIYYSVQVGSIVQTSSETSL